MTTGGADGRPKNARGDFVGGLPVVPAQGGTSGPVHTAARSPSRREFFSRLGVAATLLNCGPAGAEPAPAGKRPPKRIAAVVTHYIRNSHADVLASRMVQTDTLDGAGERPDLELVSLFMDQCPPDDIGRQLSREHGFRLCGTVAEALTLGGRELAVDGVLLIGEHGRYPLSPTGQTIYPRRRFFEEIAGVFRASGRSVPVFNDKHLAWNWPDAKWMYDESRKLGFALMAGSSIPVTWRRPPVEATLGARIRQAVGLSYGPLEGYGYHALEGLQCIVERRRGGETGVAAVQLIEGPAVWEQRAGGRFSERLLEAALGRRESVNRSRGPFAEAVPGPAGFFIEYRDGLEAVIIHDRRDVHHEWIVAWDEAGRDPAPATLFWTQETRPFGHFGFLMQAIEEMFHTGKPTWPVERTLLTTGVLAAAFESRMQGGARIETPHLAIAYEPTFTWTPRPPANPSSS